MKSEPGAPATGSITRADELELTRGHHPAKSTNAHTDIVLYMMSRGAYYRMARSAIAESASPSSASGNSSAIAQPAPIYGCDGELNTLKWARKTHAC